MHLTHRVDAIVRCGADLISAHDHQHHPLVSGERVHVCQDLSLGSPFRDCGPQRRGHRVRHLASLAVGIIVEFALLAVIMHNVGLVFFPEPGTATESTEAGPARGFRAKQRLASVVIDEDGRARWALQVHCIVEPGAQRLLQRLGHVARV